ncbi:MAG TPA: hypothetical protein P5232_02110 [Candidatus Moranbacteria bacterium]|nr:hypothetical protein [Candidatus Moranbacteria bacterium]
MEKINVIIEMARHGKKNGFNSSRISNSEEIAEMAENIDLSGFQSVEIHTTPVERAVHTAQSIQSGFKKQGADTEIKIQEMASGILSSAGTSIEAIMAKSESSKDLNLISPEIREEYKLAVENHIASSWSKEDAGVGAWIKIMKKEIEFLKKNGAEKFKSDQLKKNGISVLEVVLRICSYLININGENKFVYSINHAGFIEPLLVYLLAEQITENPVRDGLDVFQKMGGAFEPSESVKIILKGEKVIFHLRGKIYEINREKLEKEAKKLESISIANQVIEMRKK